MIYARCAEASVTVCLMHWSSPEPSPWRRFLAEPTDILHPDGSRFAVRGSRNADGCSPRPFLLSVG